MATVGNAGKQQSPRRRGKRRPPVYLKAAERDQLLAGVQGPRDRAILTLFCYGGLRLRELQLLDRSDIDLEERTVLVRYAKGGKWRKLRLHPIPARALSEYLAIRSDDDPALFLSARGRRMHWRSIQEVVKRAAARLSIPKHITAHCLRHTFAVALLRQSKDLRVVQRALGHSNISTTSIYLMLEDDELYEAMDLL